MIYILYTHFSVCILYVSSEEAVWTILEACESIRTKHHTHTHTHSHQQEPNSIPTTANNNNTDTKTNNTINNTTAINNSNSISNKEALDDERRVYFEELKTPLAHHDK